jgi:hypothetical protein
MIEQSIKASTAEQLRTSTMRNPSSNRSAVTDLEAFISLTLKKDKQCYTTLPHFNLENSSDEKVLDHIYPIVCLKRRQK